MAWTKSLLRTPTWAEIATPFGLGIMMLTLAVLDVTRFAAQTALHDDGLLTVGKAAVGGLLVGVGTQRALLRVAASRQSETSVPTDV